MITQNVAVAASARPRPHCADGDTLTAPVPIVTLPLAVAEVILVARGGRDAEVEIDAVRGRAVPDARRRALSVRRRHSQRKESRSPGSIPTCATTGCGFSSRPTATDDYQAIVAWGELDPGFGNKPILLAFAEDGESLAAEGPRLVVPGDIRGGRYVFGASRPSGSIVRASPRARSITSGGSSGTCRSAE
jgi:hypothetical protein